MLYDKGHPHRDRRTRDDDLVRQFLDGLLDQDAHFEVEFNKEPTSIEDAVFYAVSFLQIMKSTHKDGWKQRRPTRRATECTMFEDKQQSNIAEPHTSPYKNSTSPLTRVGQTWLGSIGQLKQRANARTTSWRKSLKG
ncbi:hypothetical protein DPMN_075755 [Dreissena polymorpha]|uniref:Uncharacterized protein n=1 Tax=Dreissena polymorpha TaxID=45954 RepID=A0A9D3YIQ9_DREPO|nr:hypothetical protein DPMN_075755 [Dreissena polymorpha]